MAPPRASARCLTLLPTWGTTFISSLIPLARRKSVSDAPRCIARPLFARRRTPRSGLPRKSSCSTFTLLRLLCRVIRQERIDIIHAHNYEGALIGIMAKWLTRRPLLYNAVNLMTDELAGYRFIRPAWLAHGLARGLDWFTPIFPDHITAVSPELRDWFVEHGVPAAKSRHGAGRDRAGIV